MTVTLTDERKQDLRKSCTQLLSGGKKTIRELAKVIGKIVASFPAVKFWPLHYRCLEENKKAALNKAQGNYDSTITLTPSARQELLWWIDNTLLSCNDIVTTDPVITVFSDASKTGWGCACEGERSGGLWLPVEAAFHINYLELKAAFFAWQCFQSQLCMKHVRLLGNSTAVACVNNMGTSHSHSCISCNELTHAIWQWCVERHIWLSAAHIPGKLNTAADEESRAVNIDAEWKLDSNVLKSVFSQLQTDPTIDLFASSLNKQLSVYVSYRADPQAHAVDAFSLSWSRLNFYTFPPFSVIPRVLQKIQTDMSCGILIMPAWPTQVWWPW